MDLTPVDFTPVFFVALIMAIAQVIKTQTSMNSKYIPAINFLLGILSGTYIYGFRPEAIIVGLAIGASASGTFDFATKTFISEQSEEVSKNERS